MHTAYSIQHTSYSILHSEYILIYFPVLLLRWYCSCSRPFTFLYWAASNKKKSGLQISITLYRFPVLLAVHIHKIYWSRRYFWSRLQRFFDYFSIILVEWTLSTSFYICHFNTGFVGYGFYQLLAHDINIHPKNLFSFCPQQFCE
jgi:hypothetical protein